MQRIYPELINDYSRNRYLNPISNRIKIKKTPYTKGEYDLDTIRSDLKLKHVNQANYSTQASIELN